jgi:hypothetical protein
LVKYSLEYQLEPQLARPAKTSFANLQPLSAAFCNFTSSLSISDNHVFIEVMKRMPVSNHRTTFAFGQ